MSQPWFTASLAELRKSMHKSEARWLKCTTGDDQVVYRNEYLKARQSYSKAVKKAKREFQYRKRIQLKAELQCPRKFWGFIKRMNICKSKKKNNVLEVFDEEGNIKKDDEAVEVWFNHFSKLLGGGSMRDAHSAPESSFPCRVWRFGP